MNGSDHLYAPVAFLQEQNPCPLWIEAGRDGEPIWRKESCPCRVSNPLTIQSLAYCRLLYPSAFLVRSSQEVGDTSCHCGSLTWMKRLQTSSKLSPYNGLFMPVLVVPFSLWMGVIHIRFALWIEATAGRQAKSSTYLLIYESS